jgi:hypothetical protein
MMTAVGVMAVSLATWNRAIDAFDAYRFRKGWDTRDVTGEVIALDRKGGMVTISLGSDDGLSTGEQVYVFREEPKPRYLGKVRIVSVDYESACGQIVLGGSGAACQTGDCVAHFTWANPDKPFVCGTPSLGRNGRLNEAGGRSR